MAEEQLCLLRGSQIHNGWRSDAGRRTGAGNRPPAGERQITSGSLRGIVAMVAATAFFCCGDAAMKFVSGSLPTGEMVFLRSSFSSAFVAMAATWTGAILTFRRALVPIMGWRSAGDAGGSLFFQAALARMPFADIMGILQVTPLTQTAASAFFLGERVGWRRWTAISVGLAGALLVIKPGSSTFNPWALLAVLAVVSGTLRDISTRRLDVTLSPLIILLVCQMAVAVASLACAAFEDWAAPGWRELFFIGLAGIFSLCGHLCIIHSLRSGEIAAVAPFRYAGIIWAILLGYLIWRELPDQLSLIGIFILSSAGVYTFYREQKLRRSGQTAARQSEK